MRTALGCCGCFLMLCAGLWMLELSTATRDLRRKAVEVPAMVAEQAQALRLDTIKFSGELAAIVQANVLAATERQIRETRKDIIGEIRGVQGLVDEHATNLEGIIDTRLSDVTGAAVAAGLGLQPSLANLASATGHLDEAAKLLPEMSRNTLGALAAFKVTSGETARTMRDVQDALPKFLATAQQIGDDSQKSTAATARVMSNLAIASKPLPTWARVGLAVGPPVVGVTTAVVTTLAIRGKPN